MGKNKHKKAFDPWDVPAEQQLAIATEIYEHPEIAEDEQPADRYRKQKPEGVATRLNNAINGRINKTKDTVMTQLRNAGFPVPNEEDEEEEAYTGDIFNPANESVEDFIDDDVRVLRFDINRQLNRMVIDDGISPTPFHFKYFDIMSAVQINLSEYAQNEKEQAEYIDNAVAGLFLFIITTKHPYAIMTEDEFKRSFQNVVEIGKPETYKFFSIGEYILIYIIDDESFDNFMDWLDEIGMSDFDVLTTMINIAKLSINVHNCFDVSDDDYIKKCMESISQTENAVSLIMEDRTTQISRTGKLDDEDINKVFLITDLAEYRVGILQFLKDITEDEQIGSKQWDDPNGQDDTEVSDKYDTEQEIPEQFNPVITSGQIGTALTEAATNELDSLDTAAVTMEREMVIKEKVEIAPATLDELNETSDQFAEEVLADGCEALPTIPGIDQEVSNIVKNNGISDRAARVSSIVGVGTGIPTPLPEDNGNMTLPVHHKKK